MNINFDFAEQIIALFGWFIRYGGHVGRDFLHLRY
jgi:hypothetical protein